MDKLANCINPLDDTPVPDDDIVNHVRLSRCFFYVSDILRQVIENGGVEPRSKHGKKEFTLTQEMVSALQASETPISVSQMAKYLNTLIDLGTTKKISAASINQWLLDSGLLILSGMPNGQQRKMPTPLGNEMGIFAEQRTGQFGTYTVVLFNAQAQQLVYDHIDAIIALKNA